MTREGEQAMTERKSIANCQIETRAEATRDAIHAHAHPADFQFGDTEALLIDLLTDLRHWAGQQEWQPREVTSGEKAPGLFDYAVRRSAFHYPEDLADCRICHREGIESGSRCAWASSEGP